MSGVLAFLGYAATKSLKRGRYDVGQYPQYPQYPSLVLPHRQSHHQPQQNPRQLSPSLRAAPTVSDDRKTKEFLIQKGKKAVGRGWFYVENRK